MAFGIRSSGAGWGKYHWNGRIETLSLVDEYYWKHENVIF